MQNQKVSIPQPAEPQIPHDTAFQNILQFLSDDNLKLMDHSLMVVDADLHHQDVSSFRNEKCVIKSQSTLLCDSINMFFFDLYR